VARRNAPIVPATRAAGYSPNPVRFVAFIIILFLCELVRAHGQFALLALLP
jgi:hypothetical protein